MHIDYVFFYLTWEMFWMPLCKMIFAKSYRKFKKKWAFVGVWRHQYKPLLFPAWVWNSCEVHVQADDNKDISFACW